MNKIKTFMKKHKKELILVGGLTLVATIVFVLTRRVKVNTITTVADVSEEFPEGYDIWAMVGTKCSPELFNDMKKLAEDAGKTIYYVGHIME